jgi:hypothetical protein
MVNIDPNDTPAIIKFKPKDRRPYQRDDKFEIFRSAIGLADVRDILDLTHYQGSHATDQIYKERDTITDINSYESPFIFARINDEQLASST